MEVDHAAGEHGVAEDDRAAGEHGAAEVAAVEDHPGEVELQALPGHRRVVSEMRGDDPDDGMAHFPVRPVSGPVSRDGILARLQSIGQAQITAQHINAGLPVLGPVIRQARHGIHPGQPDRRRLITAQLPGRRGEPLVQGPGALLPERPIQLLTLLLERLLRVPAGSAAAGNLHQHRSHHGEDDAADRDDRRGDLRAHD